MPFLERTIIHDEALGLDEKQITSILQYILDLKDMMCFIELVSGERPASIRTVISTKALRFDEKKLPPFRFES